MRRVQLAERRNRCCQKSQCKKTPYISLCIWCVHTAPSRKSNDDGQQRLVTIVKKNRLQNGPFYGMIGQEQCRFACLIWSKPKISGRSNVSMQNISAWNKIQACKLIRHYNFCQKVRNYPFKNKNAALHSWDSQQEFWSLLEAPTNSCNEVRRARIQHAVGMWQPCN